MAHDITTASPAQIDEWIRRAYHPHRTLDALLSELASSLMHWLPLRELTLRVDGLGVLRGGREERGLQVEWERVESGQQRPSESAVGASQWLDRHDQIRIVHAGQSLGDLSLRWQAGLSEAPLSQGGLAHLGGWLGRLCHRIRVSSWSPNGQRAPLLLIGASAALMRFEHFVERAAQSDLAVLMRGEFGTEKAWAAAAIHLASRRRAGPLVEVHCSHPLDSPAAWLQRAQGGTLFLNGIDELAPSLQMALLGHWMAAHRPSVGEPVEPGKEGGVRLVASTTADLRQPSAAPLVAQALHAELDYLHADIPPLRSRPGDISFLMDAALERLDQIEPPRCDAPLLQAFQTYAWHGNLSELERTVACLATLAEGAVIHLEDARRHTPWLLSTGEAGDAVGAVDAENEVLVSTTSLDAVTQVLAAQVSPPSQPGAGALRPLAPATGFGPTAAPHSAAQWVSIVLERQARVLDTVHPGLRRALLFLSEHFSEPVSLTALADEAHVSASHLTYLFRSSLGMSFKSFLLHIRIHVAQELLRQPQLRITEVSLRAGFADLSHFERCFRRAVGRSAREHRRALAGGE